MEHVRIPGCPFCNGDIEHAVFAEHEDFRAVYNAAPILPGHSLVIPKWHVPSLLELSDSEVSEMVRFSRLVVSNLTRVFRSTGFNWTIQEGASAGQTVPHLHLHLIPRADGDLPEPGDWYPRLQESLSKHIDSSERRKLSRDEMYRVAQHIKSEWQDPPTPR